MTTAKKTNTKEASQTTIQTSKPTKETTKGTKHQVTVYSTEHCPWCHRAKDFFKENHIEFKDYNVGDDEKALHEMVHKSKQMGVPVIDIDGKIILGFDVVNIKKALEI